MGRNLGSSVTLTCRSSCSFVSPNVVRVIEVGRMEEGRSAFIILTGTPTGKRPLGRPRRGWEDNIKIDLKETGIDTTNWVIRLRIRIIGEPL
jgi:hypothetical protein